MADKGSAAHNPTSSLIGHEFGNYRVVARLGEGGMGTVYRARQINMDRDVALKVINTDLAQMDDFTARFEREAKMLASLSHANILKVFDYGHYERVSYLVMELLNEGSLADLLIRHGPLSPQAALRYMDQIASALDYAHQRGIIHRDLKPQNVLLDDSRNALLTDFGLAKLVHASTRLTQSGTAVGTPAYMAPEQWTGDNVDSRADIYSLGIMLFEMLSGKLPFEGATTFRLMHMHIYESPRLLQEIVPELPMQFDWVIAQALAKQPDDRFRTAGDMATAFRSVVQGRPVPEAVRPVASGSNLAKVSLLPLDAPSDEQPQPAPATLNLPPASRAASAPRPANAAAHNSPPDKKTASAGSSILLSLLAVAALAVGVLLAQTVMQNSGQVAPTAAVVSAATTPANVVSAASTTAATAATVTQNIVQMPTTAQGTATRTALPTETPTRRPSATPSSTPTTRPSATPAARRTGPVSVIASVTTNLRAGAGVSHPVVVTLEKGRSARVLGKMVVDGETWYQVLLHDGAPAWVYAPNVTLDPPDTVLPVVTPLPLPPRR